MRPEQLMFWLGFACGQQETSREPADDVERFTFPKYAPDSNHAEFAFLVEATEDTYQIIIVKRQEERDPD